MTASAELELDDAAASEPSEDADDPEADEPEAAADEEPTALEDALDDAPLDPHAARPSAIMKVAIATTARILVLFIMLPLLVSNHRIVLASLYARAVALR